jgi:hypothetical protein
MRVTAAFGTETRRRPEFREFLVLVPIGSLFMYVRQCLDMPFQKSGAVLQDLVNELGRRLDFEVENGLYQGHRKRDCFHGIWRFPKDVESQQEEEQIEPLVNEPEQAEAAPQIQNRSIPGYSRRPKLSVESMAK